MDQAPIDEAGIVLVRSPRAAAGAGAAPGGGGDEERSLPSAQKSEAQKSGDPRCSLEGKKANLKAYKTWMKQGSFLVRAKWRPEVEKAFDVIEECIDVPTCPECSDGALCRGMHRSHSARSHALRRNCGRPGCGVGGTPSPGYWHCGSCGFCLCERCGDVEARELHAEGTSDIEDRVVGPALPYVWRANCVVWLGFFILLGVGWYIVDVDSQGIADSPTGSKLAVGVVIFACGSLFALYLEVLAAMYVLPSQAVAVGENKLSFRYWLPLMAIVSLILHADIYTTAVFIARVMKSTTRGLTPHIEIFEDAVSRRQYLTEYLLLVHSPCNQINWQWRQAVEQGALNNIPFLRDVTFVELTMMAGFVFVLQLAYALCYSWPSSPNLNARDINEKTPDTSMILSVNDHAARYNTILKKSTGHGRALQALAESGRMIILNWQDDLYLELAEHEWKSASVVQEMRRGNVRFLMFGLQSVLIPNLQVTYLGIQEGRDAERGADWLTFLSICLTVIGGLKYVFWELFTLRKHAEFVASALKADEERATRLRDNELAWDTKLWKQRAHFRTFFNGLFVVFFVGAYIYLAIKAYMCMVVCSEGMWNWHATLEDWRDGTLHMDRGCVHLTLNNSSLPHVCSDNP